MLFKTACVLPRKYDTKWSLFPLPNGSCGRWDWIARKIHSRAHFCHKCWFQFYGPSSLPKQRRRKRSTLPIECADNTWWFTIFVQPSSFISELIKLAMLVIGFMQLITLATGLACHNVTRGNNRMTIDVIGRVDYYCEHY